MARVIAGIGPEVADIIVVDDACPEGTGARIRATVSDPRVRVIVHARNTGVGGATKTGYAAAIESGADVLIKIDGDGQMDPALIPTLVAPIAAGEADYVKGNRFLHPDGLGQMPPVRLFGNLVLSFLSKLSSGYWNIFDPTNGFTAIHARVAARLPLTAISDRYFFESDMLFQLYRLRAVVLDVPVPTHYGDEESGVRVPRAVVEFALKHLRNAMARVLHTYFRHDLSLASVNLLLGTVLLVGGGTFGAVEWGESIASGVPATAGTVILAALPVLLGAQFLTAFFNHDVRNVPKAPIHPILDTAVKR